MAEKPSENLSAKMGSTRPGLWYEEASRLIVDPRFRYMNHGYASVETNECFDWLPEDQAQSYSANLVYEMVRGLPIDGAQVVDIGCGRGGACALFVNYFKPQKVTGIDISPGNISFCQETYPRKEMTFIRASAIDLRVPPESFDVVFNLESSHLYTDLVQFFRGVNRILKMGGHFAYSDICQPKLVPLRTELLRHMGFSVLESKDVTQNVAEAIHKGSQEQREFYDELISQNPESAKLLDPLYRVITQKKLREYREGKKAYQIWKLRKAKPRPIEE